MESERNPRILRVFALPAVLLAIAKRPPAVTLQNPAPRVPQLLHITVDEIQTAFDWPVAYQGGGLAADKPLQEPLSTALNRALMGAISSTQELFGIGTFAGTARRYAKELLDPTDYESQSVLLQPLVPDAVARIVASFERRDALGHWTGAHWLALGEPFERLLRAVGGNSRALECLETVMLGYRAVPSTLPLDGMVAPVTPLLAQKYSLESWGKHSSGVFGLLLALAGIPLERDASIPGPG